MQSAVTSIMIGSHQHIKKIDAFMFKKLATLKHIFSKPDLGEITLFIKDFSFLSFSSALGSFGCRSITHDHNHGISSDHLYPGCLIGSATACYPIMCQNRRGEMKTNKCFMLIYEYRCWFVIHGIPSSLHVIRRTFQIFSQKKGANFHITMHYLNMSQPLYYSAVRI